MRKLSCLLLCLWAMTILGIPVEVTAQSGAPSGTVIRYHYGDNLAWAAPSFDDSSWPVAANGSWPVPAFHSDGFVWMRASVPVPSASTKDLAVRVVGIAAYTGPEQVFVNGRDAGNRGEFPPLGAPVYSAPSAVFILPHGTAAPGSTALVAVRIWYLPAWRTGAIPSNLRIRISDADTAELAQHAAFLSNALSLVPDLALNSLLALVGVGLFVLWFRIRRGELLWCAALLIFYPLLQWFWDATHPDYLSVPCREYALLWVLFMLPSMMTTVEFIWTVHRLHAPAWRRAAHLAWIVYNTAFIVALSSFQPSSLARWSTTAVLVSVQGFNAITLGANLWVLFVRRYNRAIAAAMCVIPLASGISSFGWQADWRIGTVSIGLFDVGFLLSGFAIAVMLVRRALVAWRQSDQLRVEFAAAREVQQRLVPIALPQIDRIHLRAVYLPAAEVGGDFYQVFAQIQGSALVVVGDVSGKGLSAAMTGSVVLGALRALAQENLPPAQILTRLNDQLAASSDGGFVTCLCARTAADGTLTLANAGHLAPYRNGEEVHLESSLPLGVTADTVYAESTIQLTPGDTLTFLSDGVVEAQSPAGDLFGFERTRAISMKSAQEISAAAQAFGQQDDITVLTLQFAPAEVFHA